MTDHIHKSYSDGTRIDLYIQRPGRNWGRVIAIAFFILMGIAAMSQGQSLPAAHPAFSTVPAPATPWYVYVGISIAIMAGISLILLGSVWLISMLVANKQKPQATPQPQADPEGKPIGIEIAPNEVAARARVIEMKRRAS